MFHHRLKYFIAEMIPSKPLKEGGGDGDIEAKDGMCLPEKHED